MLLSNLQTMENYSEIVNYPVPKVSSTDLFDHFYMISRRYTKFKYISMVSQKACFPRYPRLLYFISDASKSPHMLLIVQEIFVDLYFRLLFPSHFRTLYRIISYCLVSIIKLWSLSVFNNGTKMLSRFEKKWFRKYMITTFYNCFIF